MGVKSKIEQAINRARREGRIEDVTKLQGNLAALKKQRGDAAWARANTYKVKPGDSFFSIAGSELGSERWVQQLLRANPGVNWLTPGMEILLPSADGDAPSISQTDFDDILAYLDPDGQTLEQKQNTSEPSTPETAGHSNSSTQSDPQEDAIVSAAVAGLQQLQQTDPTLYNQFATLIGLPPLPPTTVPAADAARQAAFEAREARLAGGLPAKKPAGSKVWRRPAKQGITDPPPPNDPTPFPGLEDDKNIKWRQKQKTKTGQEPTSTPISPATYIVKEGDGLLNVVLEYGVSLKQLMEANNLSAEDVLQIGQLLIVPRENANPFKPTEFIKEQVMGFESYIDHPYNDDDKGGNCTVGYGHLIHYGECNGGPEEAEFQYVSLEKAKELFYLDILTAEEAVKANVEVKLNQNQFDALVSFAYNIGTGYFQTSDVLAILNNGAIDQVPLELRRYIFNNEEELQLGLLDRRQFEADLFAGKVQQ